MSLKNKKPDGNPNRVLPTALRALVNEEVFNIEATTVMYTLVQENQLDVMNETIIIF